jgi:hypothetical protein
MEPRRESRTSEEEVDNNTSRRASTMRVDEVSIGVWAALNDDTLSDSTTKFHSKLHLEHVPTSLLTFNAGQHTRACDSLVQTFSPVVPRFFPLERPEGDFQLVPKRKGASPLDANQHFRPPIHSWPSPSFRRMHVTVRKSIQ